MFFGKAPHRGNYVPPTEGIRDTPPWELEIPHRGNYRNCTEKISKALDTAEGIRHKRITGYNRRSKMTFEGWANKEYHSLENFLSAMEDAGCCDADSIWCWMEKSFNAGKRIGLRGDK